MMIQCCTDIFRCIVPVCTQIILCVCTIVLGGFLSTQDLHTERIRERERRLTPGRTPFIIFIHIASTKLLSYFFLSSSPSLYT